MKLDNTEKLLVILIGPLVLCVIALTVVLCWGVFTGQWVSP